MKRALYGLMLLSMVSPMFAKSFGTIGETFPVREMSLLLLIEQRLKTLTESGTLSAMESQWQAQAETSVNRPNPVGLPRATASHHHHYDPTLILSHPILNERGQVLYAKGFRVNGLESRSEYNPCWLFLNGDDKAQLLWARSQLKQCSNPKIILTGGAVRDAETTLDSVIYFDQEGHLSKRFQLSTVPAKITREGNQLLISELAIKENGDAI